MIRAIPPLTAEVVIASCLMWALWLGSMWLAFEALKYIGGGLSSAEVRIFWISGITSAVLNRLSKAVVFE